MSTTPYFIPKTGETEFEVHYISIDDHLHRIATAGNSEGIPVVIIMGVFEDSLMDSRWLVDRMSAHPKGKSYRFIVITLPFLEDYAEIKHSEHIMARFDGFKPPGTTISMAGKIPVDPRYDLRNMATTLRAILLDGLSVEQAHFVGHDRGCIIMDSLLGRHPEMALSYSRGSQGWTKFDSEWLELVEQGIFLGPPHNIMRTEVFPGFLANAIQRGFPFYFSCPSFAKQAALASPDSELGQRWSAFMGMAKQSAAYYERTREIFRQTDFADEIAHRIDPENSDSIVQTSFPLMQYQGSEEMIRAEDVEGARPLGFWAKLLGVFSAPLLVGLGRFRFKTYRFAELPNELGLLSNHVGDQPYFGEWNLFPDEVEDIFPGGQWQDREHPDWKAGWARYVTEHADGRYVTIQTKSDARMTRFAVISESTHWTHIENPDGCAWAIMDFIADSVSPS